MTFERHCEVFVDIDEIVDLLLEWAEEVNETLTKEDVNDFCFCDFLGEDEVLTFFNCEEFALTKEEEEKIEEACKKEYLRRFE
jgi:hypothetical protein